MPCTRSTCAIVVVNYGSSQLLMQNLRPLSRSIAAAGVDAVCIVVDNFSSGLERARVVQLSADEGWELVASKSNVGFGGGMNLGMARAFELGVARLVLLNPDALLTLDGLTTMDAAVAASPRTLFAPIVLRPDGRVWSAGSILDMRNGRVGRLPAGRLLAHTVPWLSGACLGMSRQLWKDVGGFAEEYFLYWEDVELSFHVRAVGGELRVLDDVHVIHDDGGTQRTEPRRDRGKSAVYYYFNIRNHLLFAARNLSAAELRLWLRAAPAVSREIMLRGGRRQFLRRPFSLASAFLRGRRDGRRIARARLDRDQDYSADEITDGPQ